MISSCNTCKHTKNKKNTEEALVNLHTAIVNAVTTIKPKHVHRTKGKHGTRMQADIRALGKILRCLRRDPVVINTLPRLLMSMAFPDERITRMHSPQVDEVL